MSNNEFEYLEYNANENKYEWKKISFENITGTILVQPGITPPSEVPNLSKAFMDTPGAKGCTGELQKAGEICKRENLIIYAISNKPKEILEKALKENIEKNPNTDIVKIKLISDPEFKLAELLNDLKLGKQEDFLQEIDKTFYYKRFSFSIKEGQIIENLLNFYNPGIEENTPALNVGKILVASLKNAQDASQNAKFQALESPLHTKSDSKRRSDDEIEETKAKRYSRSPKTTSRGR